MLLNYHIGRFVLDLLCVGVRVQFGWGGIRGAGFSRQPGYHPSRIAPLLQHTANQERNGQCGSSITWPQTPVDGHINARNMLSL